MPAKAKPLSKLSAGQHKVLQSDAARNLTKAEKQLLISRGAKISLGGEYKTLVPKGGKVNVRTPLVTRTKYQDYRKGVSHSTATAKRRSGELEYKSAAAEEQAKKTMAVREIKRKLKGLDEIHRPANARHASVRVEKISQKVRELYPTWSRKYAKWRSGYASVNDALEKNGPSPLEDWEFYLMSDIAREINDRAIIDLRGGSFEVI